MTGPDRGHRVTDMSDPAWIAARIGDTARRWGSADRRVNATLWWYSASSTISRPLLHAAVESRPIPRPDPQRFWLRGSMRPA